MKKEPTFPFYLALALLSLLTACAWVPEMKEAPKDDGGIAPSPPNSISMAN